jgi:hypothetical protein
MSGGTTIPLVPQPFGAADGVCGADANGDE